MMTFRNVYEDDVRAESYAHLGFPGTYFLAYRDVPAVLQRHAQGRRAVDFGCGTGRSTRFLREHGFDAVGVDISPQMIALARQLDPTGDYRLVQGPPYDDLGAGSYDVGLAMFTFDNIPGLQNRIDILAGLGALLAPEGILVLVDSTPELYVNDWASFSCREFQHNHHARSGDIVSTRVRDVDDARPVEDVLWLHEDYLAAFHAANLRTLEVLRSLARGTEPFPWVNETRLPPWVIYVLGR